MEWDEELRDTFKNAAPFSWQAQRQDGRDREVSGCRCLTAGRPLFWLGPLPGSPPAEAKPIAILCGQL